MLVRMQESMLHISKSSVHRILSEHLHIRRVCSTWVPHFLMCKQVEQCVEVAKEWVQRVRRDCNVLFKVITCDKMWVHYFDPKGEHECKFWRTSSSSKTKKVHQWKSASKVILCVFFDAQGVIYQHVVPPKTKINAIYYVQVFGSLQKHINKNRPEIVRSWILHQNNVRPHVASSVCNFLEKREIPTVAHPPYSPDLAPCDSVGRYIDFNIDISIFLKYRQHRCILKEILMLF